MIVPQYWGEAKSQKRIKGRQVTVKRFGWSDLSEAEARLNAQQLADEAHAVIESGKRIERSEPKIPYNGADGVPIREEIVHRFEETIITRNSYGALCLNTPDVLFADVDYDSSPGKPTYLLSLGVLLSLAAYLGVMEKSWGLFIVCAGATVVFFALLATFILKLKPHFPEAKGGSRSNG